MTNPSKARPVHEESTYQMLVESEEKGRAVTEDLVYLLLVIATATAIWQFTQQPVTIVDLGAADPHTTVALRG